MRKKSTLKDHRGKHLMLATADVLVLSALTGLLGHAKVAPLTWGGRVLEWFPSISSATKGQ